MFHRGPNRKETKYKKKEKYIVNFLFSYFLQHWLLDVQLSGLESSFQMTSSRQMGFTGFVQLHHRVSSTRQEKRRKSSDD